MTGRCHFSPEAAAALQASGWTPERRVDLEPLLKRLHDYGYSPHPVAVATLESLYGLRVPGRGRLGISFSTADHVAAVLPYPKLVGASTDFQDLYPLGTTSTSVFIGSDGVVYSVDDEGGCWARFSNIDRAMDVFLGVDRIAAQEAQQPFQMKD